MRLLGIFIRLVILVKNKARFLKMEVRKVNEETESGNYVIEVNSGGRWQYVTTEMSISVASQVAENLKVAVGMSVRVLSRRSSNMVLVEI